MGNFLYRIRTALARFMYGRNGPDQLGFATLWVCILLELASSLLVRKFPVAGSLIYYASLALWVWLLFRMFSKNLTKRRAENQRWLNWWWKVKNGGSGARARHADKEHKYFTCKNCKAICRVPVGKGKVIITCPKCGAEIHGKT